jgi:hypothetical protein
MICLSYPNRSYNVISTYSEKRAKKDKYEFDKQITKVLEAIGKQESGKRAKFIRKSKDHKDSFVLNEELKEIRILTKASFLKFSDRTKWQKSGDQN